MSNIDAILGYSHQVFHFSKIHKKTEQENISTWCLKQCKKSNSCCYHDKNVTFQHLLSPLLLQSELLSL